MRRSVVVATVFGMSLVGAARPATARPETLVLRGATVYVDADAAPLSDASIVVSDGRIAAVGATARTPAPAGAVTLDCTGLTIVPGLWNVHVHFTEPVWNDAAHAPAAPLAAHLRDMLTRWGFTTVVDTGSMLENTQALRRRIDAGEFDGPRILTAGGPIYPPDGLPFYVKEALPPQVLEQLAQPATPDAATRAVDDLVRRGADLVKLFTGSWVVRGRVLPMPGDIAAAAVVAAHRAGKLVFSHTSNLAGTKVAIDAGVDVIAHAIEDTRGIDDALLARMKTRHLAIVPTLALFADAGADMTAIRAEIARYVAIGGELMFGTDVGFITRYDTKLELEQLTKAGLTTRQILDMLTRVPAARFGVGQSRGRIAPGFVGDLTVLAHDPASDPLAFADVRYTVRGGRIIFRAAVKNPH
jgi:imidazolonepropionase-like amidohydrolase